MLSDYIAASNDTSILARALPLAEKELAWWATNRTSTITSPYTNNSYPMARYAAANTAPRPESYLTGVYDAHIFSLLRTHMPACRLSDGE